MPERRERVASTSEVIGAIVLEDSPYVVPLTSAVMLASRFVARSRKRHRLAGQDCEHCSGEKWRPYLQPRLETAVLTEAELHTYAPRNSKPGHPLIPNNWGGMLSLSPG